MNLFLDTETVGLHGMPVLIQYAYDDGEIHLFEPWKEQIGTTLDLLEEFMKHVLIGFNLSFDHFHLVKLYSIFEQHPRDWIPEQHIKEIALSEANGRDGNTLKPFKALDLMLESRRGKFQSLMARNPIRIRRVPTALAYALATELENLVEIDGIYFAKNADPDAPKWKVLDIKDKYTGEVDPELKDVVLRFNAAGGLKFLAEYALKITPKAHFSEIELDKKHRPFEKGWIPFATGITDDHDDWVVTDANGERLGVAWPAVIQLHIDHWHENQPAREYAYDDVVYTRKLYDYFDRPEPGDNDSELACMVACVRWRGFEVDIEGLKELMAEAMEYIKRAPVNINAPTQVKAYIMEVMDETEKLIVMESTKKSNLEAVTTFAILEDEPCTRCEGTGCVRCNGKGKLFAGQLHPAAQRAKEILQIKSAYKEVELYSKLIDAGRFHASFKVIGTMSSRMSGSDGLNAQGIKRSEIVRKMFTLSWKGMILSGGDFDSFEVTLADAVYKDPDLHDMLLSGKKLHGIFGTYLRPGWTYEEVLASDKQDDDVYSLAKACVFTLIYGGDWSTMVRNSGIDKEIAQNAEKLFFEQFPDIPKARKRVGLMFSALVQPNDGGQIFWRDPKEYIESFLGFRRYYTLENKIIKTLYNLAQNIPKEWRQVKLKVQRNRYFSDRVQTAFGATCSALYGAAFSIQGSNVRSACNHEIQSPGGDITKDVQRKIWNLQPVGVGPLVVAPMNIHDEILCVNHPDYTDRIAVIVEETVEGYREQVPLIGMAWYKRMSDWAGSEKSGLVHIKAKVA